MNKTQNTYLESTRQEQFLEALVGKFAVEIVKKVIQELENNGITPVPQKKEDEILNRKETLAFLKIGSTKLNELVQDGTIAPIRLGKKTNFFRADLLLAMKSLQPKTTCRLAMGQG